jgi:hypothetical protein
MDKIMESKMKKFLVTFLGLFVSMFPICLIFFEKCIRECLFLNTNAFLSISLISLSLSLFVSCLKIKFVINDIFITTYIVIVFTFIITTLLFWILNIVDNKNNLIDTNILLLIGIILHSLAITTYNIKEKLNI